MDVREREAYIEGRLQGLNQLITILKESMESDSQAPVGKIITSHMASEMQGVIKEMQALHEELGVKPGLELKSAARETEKLAAQARKIEERSSEVKPQEIQQHAEAHSESADDLMSNLTSLRQKTKPQDDGELIS